MCDDLKPSALTWTFHELLPLKACRNYLMAYYWHGQGEARQSVKRTIMSLLFTEQFLNLPWIGLVELNTWEIKKQIFVLVE